jgi:hypothetical protein
MDCSIEVTVEYPATTTRWLISQEAKIFIASTRDDDDPLHFNRTELHTLPVIYRDQRQNELTEPIVEGLLCVTMLSATIAATISQLRYIKSHADVAPYISLAMLGVQALGYSATLVTDAKMLPAWPSQRYGRPYPHHLGWNILECSVKALTLAALAVTARLAQKVWRSRARARARAPLEPDRVPDDTVVLLYSFGVHLSALFFAVAVHWLSTYGTSATTLPPRVVYDEAQGMSSSHMRTGGTVMERYVGVVKEWFLLPQVIGNAVWRVNCKPLAGGILRRRHRRVVAAAHLQLPPATCRQHVPARDSRRCHGLLLQGQHRGDSSRRSLVGFGGLCAAALELQDHWLGNEDGQKIG